MTVASLDVKAYRVCIRNLDRSTESTLLLLPSPDLELQTLKCPEHDMHAGDVLVAVLQADGRDIIEFVRFTTPGIVESEDNQKTFSIKRVLQDGFELSVEYRRNRIDSRNKRDLEWDLIHAFIHIRELPSFLRALIDHLRDEYAYASLLDEKASLTEAIDVGMKDERRLQLALLDIKASLAAKRKQLVGVEKAIISACERYKSTKEGVKSCPEFPSGI